MGMENNSGKGLIFNIQRYAVQDGPGIRTTIFMKGCPLRCKWCSNPESQEPYPEIMTHDVRCIACHKCLEVCPVGAVSFSGEGREIDRERCNLCLQCAEVCPSKAIEHVGDYLTVDEVLKEVLADRVFYRNSGGGMTISGGEPLLQWQFVAELCRRAKEEDICTAIDTCGYAPWDIMEKVLKYVDLVLFDVKHMDSAKHKDGTGVDNEVILSNAKKTASLVETWIRVPLIPNFNDSNHDIQSIAEFSSSLHTRKVSILPYHELGSSKYAQLGTICPGDGTIPPSEEKVQSVRDRFESSGLKVEVGR